MPQRSDHLRYVNKFTYGTRDSHHADKSAETVSMDTIGRVDKYIQNSFLRQMRGVMISIYGANMTHQGED